MCLAEMLQTLSWVADSGVQRVLVLCAFPTQHSRGVSLAYSELGTAKPVLTQQTEPAFLSGAAWFPQVKVTSRRTVQIKSIYVNLSRPVLLYQQVVLLQNSLNHLLEGLFLNHALQLGLPLYAQPIGSGQQGGRWASTLQLRSPGWIHWRSQPGARGCASTCSSVQGVQNCRDTVPQARVIKETETGYSAELLF